MTFKTCKRCNAALPMAEFYAHAMMADGHLSFCKSCVKERLRLQRLNDPRVLERERKRGRKHDHAQLKKYRPPFAIRAHSAVARAIRQGKLVRPETCSECGERARIEAAHADYSRPLDVRWLCRRCHARWDSRQPKVAAYRAAS